MPSGTVAAIDVGTNSVLLWVGRRGDDGSPITIDDRCTITRLGRGVDRTGALDPAAIDRSLRALSSYREIARRHDASVVAVGTSALRDATNAREFLAPAHSLLGVPVEVITGEREAALTYCGATCGIRAPEGSLTVVDIGGGSTEFILADHERILSAKSVRLGSVRLFERYLEDDPPTDEQIARLRKHVVETLRANDIRCGGAVVGIAGTVTTIAAAARGLKQYDSRIIHGLELATNEIVTLTHRFTVSSLDERRHMAGVDADRADVIVAGALLLESILQENRVERLIVSDGGVRVGLGIEALTRGFSS